MIFLSVIIVFCLQRYFAVGYDFSRLTWVKNYALRWQKISRKAASPFKLLIILLPVLVLIGLLQIAFGHGLFSIIRLALDSVVLWFCWDVYSYQQQLRDYFMAVAANNPDLARQKASKWVAMGTLADQDLNQVARTVSETLFTRSAQHIFTILFWFILFGAVGALAYFLIQSIRQLASQEDSPWAELLPVTSKWLAIAEWIPVRLLALSYALVGHFITAFDYLRKNISSGLTESAHFAIEAGFAALNLEHPDVVHADREENEAALSLIDRALLLWIVILAIFTLGGWLS